MGLGLQEADGQLGQSGQSHNTGWTCINRTANGGGRSGGVCKLIAAADRGRVMGMIKIEAPKRVYPSKFPWR